MTRLVPALIACLATAALLTSCATRYPVKTRGMARVRYYEISRWSSSHPTSTTRAVTATTA